MRNRHPLTVYVAVCAAGMMPLLGLVNQAQAQQQLPGSQFPNPQLFTVVPAGAKAGTTVEVTFSGADLEDPQGLLFSHPGIKAEPVLPPTPPVDPKKPATPPAPKPPITKFKVAVAPDAPLGSHDVRLVNKWGVSNPRAFVVGDLPEVLEKEPNNDAPEAQRVALNTTIHGAISAPTDVDYFVFAGKKGQRVVVSCLATSIDSRLHAAMEMYDNAGKRLAFNHDYQAFDALMDATLPADGDYYVRLHEFTHTEGTPEHFYRLTISTAPWIDAILPPVVEAGKTAQLTVYGRNLADGKPDSTAVVDGRVLEKITVAINVPGDSLALQRLAFSGHMNPIGSALDGFEYRLRNASGISNPYLLTFAKAPVVLDNEANDTPETAQEIPVPCEVAGRIEKRHDRDWYVFSAKKGQVYNIEVFGERLGTYVDMYFSLRNPVTKQDLGDFDDNLETLTPIKFFTRTTDPPRYRFEVPADGKYQLMVSSRDADVFAGPRRLYRVRISPDQPDFRLIIMPPGDDHPDACHLLQGGNQYFTVLAWREDGWNGTIHLTAEGLPPGVICPPQALGTGLKECSFVVGAAANVAEGTWQFKVKGTAMINGQKVVREARPASVTWPVPPLQGIPVLSRLDRNLVLAVREKAPFHLAAAIDKQELVQGEKGNLSLKLARLWTDFKTPLQVLPVELPSGLRVNNNQPFNMAPGKDTGAFVVDAGNSLVPGTYNIVLRCSAQIPFNKDAKAAQKPNINIVQSSTPVVLTVLPKTVASVSVANPNITAKAGTQAEVVVKVSRLYDFAGEFKVQLVVPPNIKGIQAQEATIPSGKDEVKFMIKIAPDAALANIPDLTVRATALFNGNKPTVQETKINVNVVK